MKLTRKKIAAIMGAVFLALTVFAGVNLPTEVKSGLTEIVSDLVVSDDATTNTQ